jgi:hypothetical protein
MKLKIYTLALLSLTIFSCQTVKTGTAKTLDIYGLGVIHKPVIVDLDVKEEKISKTITLRSMDNLSAAEAEIVRELLKENNADILVEPKFYSVSKNGKTELTVTGWLGYYKNFKTIEEKDLKLLETKPSTLIRVENSQSSILEKPKK